MKRWALSILIIALVCSSPAPGEDQSGGWLGKAINFYSSESYELALLYVNKSLDIDPGYPDAWDLKGYILSDLGRYEEAADCFSRSLDIDPSGRPRL